MDQLSSTVSLRQLHYLVAVADAGSFSAAAVLEHVVQPALSRQIALLEAQVGLRLLDRSRKGVRLTEAGGRLYNLARNMLEQLDSVHAELKAHQIRPAGVVTMAAPPSLASMLVPQLVRELDSNYPEIVLRVEDGLSLENSRSLQAGLLDFGIVPAADELVDVVYEPLVRESLLLVEGENAARHGALTITFAQVARLRLVLPPRSFHTRRIIDDAAQSSMITLKIAYEQQSVATIMSLVRDGLGATITNSPVVHQLFWPPGTVSIRRIVRPQITRTISLAHHSARPLSLAAQAVYNLIKRFSVEAVNDGRWQGELL